MSLVHENSLKTGPLPPNRKITKCPFSAVKIIAWTCDNYSSTKSLIVDYKFKPDSTQEIENEI